MTAQNHTVVAWRARRHLLRLRRAGVGKRAVSAATDLSKRVIEDVANGRKARIRPRTERLILAVTTDCASDAACVEAGPTHRKVRQLLRQGFTKRQIAREIGSSKRDLEIGRRRRTLVQARSAARIDRLWRRYMTEAGI